MHKIYLNFSMKFLKRKRMKEKFIQSLLKNKETRGKI